MTQAPWFKFYPADWRADVALRSCTPTARAIWIDLLGLMHEAEPYGYLLINGEAPSVKRLCGLLNMHHKTLIAGLKDLQINGVYSVDSEGVIFSRRMVRDYEKAKRDQDNGRRGGNPNIKKKDGPGVNPPLNGQDKAQRPEARGQNKPAPHLRERASFDAGLWNDRLRQAHEHAGDAMRGTDPAAHTFRDLRLLCEPAVGEPCDWDADVLPAIDVISARKLACGEKFDNWSYIRRAAIENRDRRLAGLPPPEQPHVNGSGSPGHFGRGDGASVRSKSRSAATIIMERACADELDETRGPERA